MKKTRFLALTSLCSVLAGMPVNAGKIKDSDAKKIGGVENSSNSEGDKDLEEKNKTMNKKGKISHFVDLVKSHPIWSIIIGSGSVAVE